MLEVTEGLVLKCDHMTMFLFNDCIEVRFMTYELGPDQLTLSGSQTHFQNPRHTWQTSQRIVTTIRILHTHYLDTYVSIYLCT